MIADVTKRIKNIPLTPQEISKNWVEKIPANLSERDIVLAYIYISLHRNDGNRTKTAKQLRISKRTLWSRMDELRHYGIDVAPTFIEKSRKNKIDSSGY